MSKLHPLEGLRENMTYMEKAQQIGQEDRELVRSEIVSMAEWLRQRYPMTVADLRRFLHEMLEVSI